ncbi:MAG: hypothetical protein NC453_11445 [Muribaculum sp.]|nr:hypothetical protein [Muribaculum sp.]
MIIYSVYIIAFILSSDSAFSFYHLHPNKRKIKLNTRFNTAPTIGRIMQAANTTMTIPMRNATITSTIFYMLQSYDQLSKLD